MEHVSAPAEFLFHVRPAQLDGAVSVTSGFLANLGKGVTNVIQRHRFARNIVDVSGSIQRLIDVCDAAETKSGNDDKTERKHLTPDELDHGLRSIEYLEMIVGRMVDNLVKHGWANDSKTSATVRKLIRQREQIADIVDWLHAGIRNDNQTLAAIFKDARNEYETGESVTMDEVF